MMEVIAEELRSLGVDDVHLNEPLSRHTTWKVGGPADLFIYPHRYEECVAIMEVVRKYRLPWRVIGRGSNLLVDDEGIRGVVIKIGDGLDSFHQDGNRITVGAGYSTIRLAVVTAKKGLSGLEFAGGIPGNIGGAVYMNAGAHGSDISKVLESAKVLLETGEYIELSNEELHFRYRTTVLQETIRGLVLEATFCLKEGDHQEITANLSRFKDYRRKTQPLEHPCAGSVFRNPPGDSAGRLIEAAGLKGYRIGGACVSTLHGNFIINDQGAKAADILSLIEHIQRTVFDQFQVKLSTEVEIIRSQI